MAPMATRFFRGSSTDFRETPRITAPPELPTAVSISPSCWSIRSASRTTGRLRWNISASSRSGGSRSPGRSSPEMILG